MRWLIFGMGPHKMFGLKSKHAFEDFQEVLQAIFGSGLLAVSIRLSARC